MFVGGFSAVCSGPAERCWRVGTPGDAPRNKTLIYSTAERHHKPGLITRNKPSANIDQYAIPKNRLNGFSVKVINIL